jgi:hypothetical protein
MYTFHMQKTIIILSFFLLPLHLKAQDTLAVQGDNVLYGLVVDGDTILVSTIEEVYILPMRKFSSKREMRKYRKLIRNVKKVYPYAKAAKKKYDEVSANLDQLKTEKQKKDYMKQVEKEIKNEFEGDLKKLTISQGRILIKLIDREIGETSYDLLSQLKGKFSAFFWQTLARIFAITLKALLMPKEKTGCLTKL